MPWPLAEQLTHQARVVFVTDVTDGHELDLLRRWLESSRPPGSNDPLQVVQIKGATESTQLAGVVGVQRGDLSSISEGQEVIDQRVWLQPVRVAWLALKSDEPPSLLKDFFHGRRIQPGPLRRRWLARYRPQRVAYVVGQGASFGEMRVRHEADQTSANNSLSLVAFISYQAELTLERAERQLRGARYKIARLMPVYVFANNGFQERLVDIAREQSRSLTTVHRKAARYLDEMAATQSPFSLDLMMALSRLACRSNHDPQIDVRPEQLERIKTLLGQETVTFQISHKSMLDTLAFTLVMFEANLPVPLTFGGINLKTFGIGAFARRAGIIFLRRTFQKNELYKTVFRRYIDHLIEKRFSVLWALEGGRSRTGKLLPPKYGLFNYVMESSVRTRNQGLYYVPVSVAYDQITEVDDYAKEQLGRGKKAEGMGWMLRFFRRSGSHGKIYVRFGEPFQLGDLTNADAADIKSADDLQSLVHKTALESAKRLNLATPVTVPAIMTLILLGSGRRAQQLTEIQALARTGAAILRRRRIEIVGRADFRESETVRAALNQLNQAGIVSYFDDGLERLYRIENSQHHKASYYRNTVIHHFLLDAIAEVALLESRQAEPHGRVERFYVAAERLRELFLYEFFFPGKSEFRIELADCLSSRVNGWAEILERDGADMVLTQLAPLFAHGVLRSFADAYFVVAAYLMRAQDRPVKNDSQTLGEIMKLGRQMLSQEMIFSSESVSKSLYETGLRVAIERTLLTRSLPINDERTGLPNATAHEALPAQLSSDRKNWLRQTQALSRHLDNIMLVTLSRSVNVNW